MASLLSVLTVLSHARPARADEIDDLEKSLSTEATALATSDCASACKALSSIRRAADRICALDPGPRCAAAQAKALDAGRRVRDACPQCAAAALTPQRPGEAPVTPSPAPAPEEPTPRATPQSESVQAAAADRGKGGCASCDVAGSGSSPADWSTALLGVLAVARLLKARAGRARSRTP